MSTTSALSDTISNSESGCEFIDLINSHFKDRLHFDVWTYLDNLLELDSNRAIADIDISKILPGAELLAVYEHYDIGYHSRECTAYRVSYYRYNNRYINFSFDLEANGTESDLDILDIGYHYAGDMRTAIKFFFNDAIDIRKKIRCSKVIDNNNISDVNFMIDLYSNVHGEKGNKRFKQYMKRRYAKRCRERKD